MDHPMGESSQGPQEVLPLMRVKKLMKEEADVKAVAGDASYAAARATEFLIEELAKRAFDITAKSNRDIISYSDVAAAVSEWPAAMFLLDIVPKRIPLSELIKRLREAQGGQNGNAQMPAAPLANGSTAAPQQAGPLKQEHEQPSAAAPAPVPHKPAPQLIQSQVAPAQQTGMPQQQQQQQHYAQPPPVPQGLIMQQLHQQPQPFSQAPAGLLVQQMGAPTFRP